MEEKKPDPVPNPEETIFDESDFSLEGYDKHVKNARNMLFVIGALQLLPLLFLGPLPVQHRLLIAAVSIIVSLIFFVLALWTKQRPYAALLAASIVYVALIAINGFLDPTTLLKGAVVKAIIIVLFILGIRNAREAQRMKEEFGKK